MLNARTAHGGHPLRATIGHAVVAKRSCPPAFGHSRKSARNRVCTGASAPWPTLRMCRPRVFHTSSSGGAVGYRCWPRSSTPSRSASPSRHSTSSRSAPATANAKRASLRARRGGIRSRQFQRGLGRRESIVARLAASTRRSRQCRDRSPSGAAAQFCSPVEPVHADHAGGAVRPVPARRFRMLHPASCTCAENNRRVVASSADQLRLFRVFGRPHPTLFWLIADSAGSMRRSRQFFLHTLETACRDDRSVEPCFAFAACPRSLTSTTRARSWP